METVKACIDYFHLPSRRNARFQDLEDLDGCQDFVEMLQKLDDLGFLQMLLVRSGQASLWGRSFRLVQLLHLCRGAGCSDSRNRLFGLIGLFTSCFPEDLITADYEDTVQSVYKRFARSFIKQSQSLMLLTQASQEHNSILGLPSWVPDWTSYYNFRVELRRFSKYSYFYKASQGIDFRSLPSSETDYGTLNPDLIGLQGRIWSSVKRIGQVCTMQEDLSKAWPNMTLRP